MRQVNFPPNLPLAPRSPSDSKLTINARMPTPYAFPGPQTFEDPAGSRDEAEDIDSESTEQVLITSNVRIERAEGSEFGATEESPIMANNAKKSRQELGVEIRKIILFIRFGNTLKGSVEFKIVTWDPSPEAFYPSCKLEVFQQDVLCS